MKNYITLLVVTCIFAGTSILLFSACDESGNLAPAALSCAQRITQQAQLFVADDTTLRICAVSELDAASANPDFATVVAASFGNSTGFDDGDHMVVDRSGGRIFVSDHGSQFQVFDCDGNELAVSWGVSLSEPLGLAALSNGKLLITDEEDSQGLFRLFPDLSLDTSASGGFSFDGAEGVAYDLVHDRIVVADEDDGDLEIFDGSTLAHIAWVSAQSSSDGAYWLGIDSSSNRLFMLSDSTVSGNRGIHVFDISADGNDLVFDQTLLGSGGSNINCYGALTVSESTNRLFAIDSCNSTVAIYDTTSLTMLGTVPSACAGSTPERLAVTS